MQTEIPSLASGPLPVGMIPSQVAQPPREPVPPSEDRGVDSDLKQTIQRLFTQHGAVAMAHIRVESSGSVSAGPIRGEIATDLHQKLGKLAQQAIQQGQVLSTTLSSRHNNTLVAAPLPSFDGEAVALVFGPSTQLDSSGYIDLLSREVCLAAALMSLAKRLEPDTHSSGGEVQPGDPRDVAEPQSTGLITKLRQRIFAIENRAILYVVAVLFIVAIGFVPWPHRVRCNVTCEPAVRRFVAAPFDGKLLKSHVAPGDPIEQGQLLATLDGGDLRAQLASLQARLDQAQQRRSAAMSTGDGSKAELERFEVQYLQSEIALLESRTRRLEIRSPITGVIVGGDLERAEGAPLQVGENLFEIAPLDLLVAEVAIPESDVLYVANGMSAMIKLDAAPGRPVDAVLRRIHPRAEIRDNVSVFVAEAPVDNDDRTLRPGMSGTAKVHAGRAAIGWLLFHRPYEAARTLIGW